MQHNNYLPQRLAHFFCSSIIMLFNFLIGWAIELNQLQLFHHSHRLWKTQTDDRDNLKFLEQQQNKLMKTKKKRFTKKYICNISTPNLTKMAVEKKRKFVDKKFITFLQRFRANISVSNQFLKIEYSNITNPKISIKTHLQLPKMELLQLLKVKYVRYDG